MSELVEKVARAMHTSEEWSSFWGEDDAKKLARAAILTVLEHYSEAGNVSDEFIDVMLKHPPKLGWKPSIAAAMRAELERLRGDK